MPLMLKPSFPQSVKRFIPTAASLLFFAGIDVHDGMKKLDRIRLRPLKRVPPNDGAKPAAVTNSARLLKHILILALGSSGENDDPTPIERALNHMPDSFRQCGDRNFDRFIYLLRRSLFKMRSGKLDLNDVGAELRGNLRRIGNHI